MGLHVKVYLEIFAKAKYYKNEKYFILSSNII